MSKITLILGGIRSGKSLYAETLAGKSNLPKIYVATAEILDEEMRQRVEIHKKRRGSEWQTIEEPMEIASLFSSTTNHQPTTILIDCLTLWLSNLLHHNLDITAEIEKLANSLKTTDSEVILVSNEVGFSIIPDTPLARKFADYNGIMNQKIATIADNVVLVMAGIPMTVKGKS